MHLSTHPSIQPSTHLNLSVHPLRILSLHQSFHPSLHPNHHSSIHSCLPLFVSSFLCHLSFIYLTINLCLSILPPVLQSNLPISSIYSPIHPPLVPLSNCLPISLLHTHINEKYTGKSHLKLTVFFEASMLSCTH